LGSPYAIGLVVPNSPPPPVSLPRLGFQAVLFESPPLNRLSFQWATFLSTFPSLTARVFPLTRGLLEQCTFAAAAVIPHLIQSPCFFWDRFRMLQSNLLRVPQLWRWQGFSAPLDPPFFFFCRRVLWSEFSWPSSQSSQCMCHAYLVDPVFLAPVSGGS